MDDVFNDSLAGINLKSFITRVGKVTRKLVSKTGKIALVPVKMVIKTASGAAKLGIRAIGYMRFNTLLKRVNSNKIIRGRLQSSVESESKRKGKHLTTAETQSVIKKTIKEDDIVKKEIDKEAMATGLGELGIADVIIGAIITAIAGIISLVLRAKLTGEVSQMNAYVDPEGNIHYGQQTIPAGFLPTGQEGDEVTDKSGWDKFKEGFSDIMTYVPYILGFAAIVGVLMISKKQKKV